MPKQKMLTARTILMRERRAYQDAFIDWFERMVICHDQMLTEGERRAFQEWDHNRADGVRTDEWPGWEKYIGVSPLNGAARSMTAASPKLVSIIQGKTGPSFHK
jgi:hypothetical protein